MDILHALLGILSAAVTAIISYFATRLKSAVDAHLTTKQAQIFNHVVNGLSQIADMTVSDFNQRVVTDAKTQGVFTPALAKSVKADAVAVVKSQGSALISLAGSSISDIDQLVSSLIEQSVSKQKAQTTATASAASTSAAS